MELLRLFDGGLIIRAFNFNYAIQSSCIELLRLFQGVHLKGLLIVKFNPE